MPAHFDYENLEELSKGKGLVPIQYIFNKFTSELIDYLKIQPLYDDIIIKLVIDENLIKREIQYIFDFGVRRFVQKSRLTIEIDEIHKKYLPFILLREAYYSFVSEEASDLVKICINQIVENDLSKLTTIKEWKKLIRNSVVNSDFINSQFDKLQKFFNIEPKDPLESSIQFFFKEMRESALLSHDGNINSFYDLIFEKYSYKTSKSLFNQDIVETLRVLIKLFYETKLYLNISDYFALFREFRQKQSINSYLSLRKFNENLQWINKSSSIAPSYDSFNSTMGISVVRAIIKFHPFLEKNKIKALIVKWPFYQVIKFSENGFAKDNLVSFVIPTVYLDDLVNYFDRLEESGYIIKKELYLNLKKTSSINLNYFIDIANTRKIINPNSVKYERKYEIEIIKDYNPIPHPSPLTILDYIILDRAFNLSVTGLTFDKRIETLNAIKEDVENELRKEKLITKEFKNALDKILNSPKLKQQFLEFLDKNQVKGFLFLLFQLKDILDYLDMLERILNKQPASTNIYQLETILHIYLTIEQHLLIRDENVKKVIFRDFLPLYFQSKNSFKEEVEKLQSFFKVLNACYNLKILDLTNVEKIIKDPKLLEKIYQTRKKRYKDMFKPLSSYKITNEKIESTIEAFVNHEPPLINPFLINTILTSSFAKYYPELILKDRPEIRKKLEKLKFIFPKTFIFETSDLTTQKKYIHLSIYLVKIKEKELLLSFLNSYFKDSLVKMGHFFWRGVLRPVKLRERDFYNFEKKQFFHTKHLFNQLFTYSQKILGENLKWPKYPLNNNVRELFWSRTQDIESLVNTVSRRISNQKINFILRELVELSEFRKSLEVNMMDPAKSTDFKTKKYFKRYINSVKFLPAFQKFGFSQYYLYFRPFYYRSPSFEIDFKLLFTNSFQNIKYPASIEPNLPLFIEYIFPFRTPNKSYLNWLTKAKKIVSEYCLFYKKKFYKVVHFNRNFTKEGWNYSSIRFKSYMQDVLFKPAYDPKISEIREFDINEISDPNIYGYNTQEYEDLIQIYNIHSIDIKTHLGTRNYSIIDNITELLKKKIIFPYLSLKNLDFQDKISIILPDIKQEFNEKIIKIFSFFNLCQIYEIEGEFFIYGFQEEKTFENGLLIEIWFPKCELDEFFNVFDLLFHYLDIKHYIILTDLVNGKTLLKSVYGNLDFLKEYNPLLNLIWNDKDKIWMNHKLFNEKFEPIYPDLIKKDKQ